MDAGMLKQLIRRYENASFMVERRFNAMLRETMSGELTADQYSVMRFIQDRGRCTSSELSDLFCVGKSSITAIITRLSDKKLIRRIPDEKDRRVTYLSLTEEGEALTNRIGQMIHELLSKYLQHFDASEAEAFIRTYEKLARMLEER
jgi:DNA-binding MarR family transcriptional regulator